MRENRGVGFRRIASKKFDSFVDKHFAWRFAPRRRLERLEESLDFLARMTSPTEELVERAKHLSFFLTECVDEASKRPLSLVGATGDGSCVLHDSFKSAKSIKVLSIGVGDKVSAESDLADQGARVWLFDHTIDNLPPNRPEFEFVPKGLGVIGRDSAFLDLASMADYLAISEEDHAILMLDAEGAEWQISTISDTNSLSKFAQISIELHGLTGIVDEKLWDKIEKTLGALTANHAAVWVHGNNWRQSMPIGGLIIPDVCEVTLLRRDLSLLWEEGGAPPSKLVQAPNSLSFPDLAQAELFQPIRPAGLAESKKWFEPPSKVW